ncbi:MAG TPA: peptidoglycan DD-metalloendopeptidase family protein [Candidatus Polarisedimenticolia bacterium]|nr:peptidoglycan DD-metalloendopeptidase family protein [Candidatus Polarisedimenticolia bacterium]
MAIRFCSEMTILSHRAVAWLALLTLFAAAGAEARAGAPDDAGQKTAARRQEEEERLQKVRDEIEALRQRLLEGESSAGSVLDSMEELDLRMALLRRESESLRGDMRLTADGERSARREADSIEARLEKSEAGLRDYLRETYKIGPTRYLRVVTAASSPTQVAAGYRAIEAMNLGEAERIEAYRADRDKLEAVLAELQARRERLQSLQVSLEDKTRELREVREQKGAVLSGLQREQTSQRALLADLIRVEGEIRALLERLAQPGPAEPVPSLGFSRYRGTLDWPAKGRLSVPFGNVRHPRFSTEVPHPGVDIAASPGQDVRAVFNGRVIFSDWFKGYGQMVVIDHGDSYLSIYGHVDERLVQAGQEVDRGEVIARSGQGGSFDEPGLYFEIRHDGKPEDPARWLRAAPGPPERKRPTARQTRRTP